MSTIDRRGILKAGALAGALSAAPAAAALKSAQRVAIYDSRIAESLAFARGAGAVQAIDLYREHDTRFAMFRAELPTGSIEGLTGWSDWVALRSELESRGYRVTSEAPVRASRSGKAHLFRWSMKPR